MIWNVILISKNHTRVKNVGHTSEFSVWHLLINLKNNYLLKKLLKRKNFNIYIVVFFKNNKEKHLEILFKCY